MSGIKISGSWVPPTQVYSKVDGEWKIASQAFSKVNGQWYPTTFASPPDPPEISYVTTGTFEIDNYDPSLVYEAVYVSGSGTTSFNATNARFSLSGQTSRFEVVARYAAGAPASDPAFMERKRYSYTYRNVSYTVEECCPGQYRLDAACYCTDVWGNCYMGGTPSWGQCGCYDMCWWYYNGVRCFQQCYPSRCCRQIWDVLINEPGYINSGTEWYKVT